jgi:membrane-associated phospholipid phosphatase
MKRWWIALGSAGAFSALSVPVHLGLLNTFDAVVGEWARPEDVWGMAQMRADFVVEGLRPAVVAALLVAFTVAYCVQRRSWRPAAFVGSVGLTTALLAVATKAAVGRPDPHGLLANDGGSFPSGHTIMVIVCLGLAVQVALPRAGRPMWLVPAAGGSLMGASLLLQAAHWSTDIVGGGLFATGVLAVTTASGWSRWSHGGPKDDQGSATFQTSESSSHSRVAAVGKKACLDRRTAHLRGPRLLRSWPGEMS